MADAKQEDKPASPLAIFLAYILQGPRGPIALCTSDQPLLNRGLVQVIAESKKTSVKTTRLEVGMPKY